MKKLAVILGPTASGKTSLAVKLAKRFGGEIVSADSRQVYKGLNIGSGKIAKKEMAGVPHYLLDVASPKRRFTVAQYRRLAIPAIARIMRKKKLPILAGGSPFYIYAVTDGITIPEVKPNFALRKKLEKLSAQQLFSKLKKLDPRRAGTIEKQNPRRLIRALEIVLKTKKPVPALKKHPLSYPVLFLGIKKSKEELAIRIAKRLHARLKGMLKEVRGLHKNGLSWRRLEEFGLEYRFVSLYLQKKLGYEEMVRQLQKAIINFSRRQMTWFKKDRRIRWITNHQQAQFILKKFLF